MSKTAAKIVLSFALVVFSLAATAGGVMSVSATESKPSVDACFWRWLGPASGWYKFSDGCGGNCAPPPFSGTYVGQQEVTDCTGSGLAPAK